MWGTVCKCRNLPNCRMKVKDKESEGMDDNIKAATALPVSFRVNITCTVLVSPSPFLVTGVECMQLLCKGRFSHSDLA